jgi:glycosyltransferase involved in cell wall biosynthesis
MDDLASPRLLIIVPTLDSYALLPRLLSSLEQQTWPHWRLLFIDGPSCRAHRRWLQQCCRADPRYSWVVQVPEHSGIFGAMNQGFALAAPQDWLLFWGSDDWAASPHSLAAAMNAIEATDPWPDLLVCQGRYATASTAALGRRTQFQTETVLSGAAYRRALWLGSTPPHQATLFGAGARAKLNYYAPGFRLSADLDYFLTLSSHADLCVRCLDLELVYMSDAGVSGQQTQLRLQEVCRAYRRAFGCLSLFPFLARYFRRLLSLLPLLS